MDICIVGGYERYRKGHADVKPVPNLNSSRGLIKYWILCNYDQEKNQLNFRIKHTTFSF